MLNTMAWCSRTSSSNRSGSSVMVSGMAAAIPCVNMRSLNLYAGSTVPECRFLLQFDLDLHGCPIAHVFSGMPIGVAPGNLPRPARVVDLPAIGQRHGGMQLGQIDHHVGGMIVRWTLEVRLENSPQHAHPGVLEGHLLIGGLQLDGIQLDRPAL